MMKLQKSETRALVALMAEGEEVEAAIADFVRFLCDRHGMEGASVQFASDGAYLVAKEEATITED